jgi:hypothetical protein
MSKGHSKKIRRSKDEELVRKAGKIVIKREDRAKEVRRRQRNRETIKRSLGKNEIQDMIKYMQFIKEVCRWLNTAHAGRVLSLVPYLINKK